MEFDPADEQMAERCVWVHAPSAATSPNRPGVSAVARFNADSYSGREPLLYAPRKCRDHLIVCVRDYNIRIDKCGGALGCS